MKRIAIRTDYRRDDRSDECRRDLCRRQAGAHSLIIGSKHDDELASFPRPSAHGERSVEKGLGAAAAGREKAAYASEAEANRRIGAT